VIQQEHNTFLDHYLTLEEIEDAIYKMASEKIPALDDLSIEFYVDFGLTLGRTYTMFILRALKLGP
jgi:hypothetical protein